jgi:hypothetical protein
MASLVLLMLKEALLLSAMAPRKRVAIIGQLD